MNSLTTFLLLTILTLTHGMRLRFFGANQSGGIRAWTKAPFVTGQTFRICPSRLPSPFTLVCITPPRATSVEFFINGRKTRTEGVRPYTINGDINGVAMPWNPSGTVDVRCRLSTGQQVEATIIFECRNGSGGTRAPVTLPPTTTQPQFALNSGSVARNCVNIPALSTTDRAGWTVLNSGLFFRPPGQPGAGSLSVTSAGSVVASYSFTPPVDGTYGFTLDMDTNGGVDHNDVWVEFPAGGFTLTRGSSTRFANGWTKAYHNRNGRSNQVFSVDFNPHTFATRRSLKSGTTYTVNVGGRSTQTGFFSIIMFPCSGGQCDGTNPRNEYWRGTRDACA